MAPEGSKARSGDKAIASAHGAAAGSNESREMDQIFSLVYEELRRLASFVRRNEEAATINSTALVHEAWFKLKDSPHLAATEPAHFKAIAARAMRQILVDEARRRGARKRGGSGEAIVVALNDLPGEPGSGADETSAVQLPALGSSSFGMVRSAQLLELDTLLSELGRLNPRQAQIVENRFFGGLNVAETAAVLGVSQSSVERDWRAARAWLVSRIHS
jgi:RNA polymerase sigma factor (sigma-70 family)